MTRATIRGVMKRRRNAMKPSAAIKRITSEASDLAGRKARGLETRG